jgi:hypothetical protein
MGKIIRQAQLNHRGVIYYVRKRVSNRFSGGVARDVTFTGKIGFHRPYSTVASDSTKVAQERFDKQNALLQAYLKEMNITPRLLEVMNSISPRDARLLTPPLPGSNEDDQLKDLGIVGLDPVWEDMRASQAAARLGISRSELYKLTQRVRAECSGKDIQGYDQCRDEIWKRMKIGNQ